MPPPPPPTTPTLPAAIDSALGALALAFPDNVELITLPNKSAAGAVDIKCVRLHDGSGSKTPVLLTGGVHAREMAPPDALLRLAQLLLDAFKNNTDITFPALDARVNQPTPQPPLLIPYPAFTIPADKVQKIMKSLDLFIFPCVNPDGRLYDITNPANPFGFGWRKNRRANQDNPDPKAIGVDLNRNFDIAWDFGRYYDMASYRTQYADGPAATVDTRDTFNGYTDPANRTVTIAGGPTGGTFILSFNGADTAPIAFNAPAADVQAKLRALATIGGSNVEVTGSDGGPYTVNFVAGRGHPVAMLTSTYTGLAGGTNPQVQIKHAGPNVEPETLNVQFLIDDRKIRFFLDIHQEGRTVLVPWGMEDNGSDTAMTFQQASWDYKRDGLKAADVPAGKTNYNEYLPNDIPYYLTDKLFAIGNAMQTAILQAAGADMSTAFDPRRDHSTYHVGQASRYYDVPPLRGGPLTGDSVDYCMARQFIDSSRAPIFALAMEVGLDEENKYHPDYAAPNNHYQKIEREVFASVIEFLMAAVRFCKYCLIATAAHGSDTHPDVMFLRHLRDHELRSTRYGSRVVDVLERIYYSFSPAVARFLTPRPRSRALVRNGVVRPATWLLRGLAAACAPIRPKRLAVGVLATSLVALIISPAAAVIAALALSGMM